ncbi:MAG: hypothetical protein JWO36_3214 [Myxococcales bacterium]|nr:hypothetical protein [Myxococcales bacterium]
MVRTALTIALILVAGRARADGVFDVCKGESKTAVAGTGKLSIAVVYPDEFPVKPTPAMRNSVGEQLAKREKAIIVPAKDVLAARALVGEKRWTDKAVECGLAPSLVAVLGLKHPNLSTARAQVSCDDKNKCELIIDLERHGRPTAERFARYAAPLTGPKDKVATISAAAAHLESKGAPPDAPAAGLATTELAVGNLRVRSDIDGALEIDRTIEATAAVAACAPKGRKPHDVRGYWADWKLSARGNPFQVTVKPFGGVDPADTAAADCLRKALTAIQLACPRDASTATVRTAICL